jgi:PAS domain S-box-containing protein
VVWFEHILSAEGIRRRGLLIGYLIAIALVGCAAVIRGVLGFAPGTFPYLTFFPAIFLSAMIGGLGPGLCAAGLSGIAAWLLLPLDTASAVPGSANALPVIAYALVSVFICVVIAGFQTATDRLRAERQRVSELNAALRDALAGRSRELVTLSAQSAQNERSLALLIEGVTDYAIFMLDPTGMVTSWNPGAQRIKGYSASEILGRHFSQFYTEEDRARGEPERALAVAGRVGRYEAEGWRMRKDGSRFWANVVMQPIRDERSTLIGFAKITRDMTERRELEDHLRQAQKMDALGQLTGGIAHDFNNVLTVIGGNIETVGRRLQDGKADADSEKFIERALAGVARAERLTRQLLAFARRQPLEPKTVDADKLLAGLSDILKRTLGPRIEVEMIRGAGLWRTRIDPNQLEHSIINLAINARDAMPEGGKLTIESANASLDEAYAAAYSEVTPGQYVLISVSDNGTGMSPQVREKAFDPFFTTKPVGQGTGLGLSQVYGFLKQSGGQVTIYSEPGKGTTVKLYLPRSLTPEESLRAATLPVSDLSARGETVLVVEDDAEVRSHTAGLLRELGYGVIEAGTMASALATLQETPEIKLLLTDVGLPDGDGRKLADAASAISPALKILFMTGYTRNAIVHHGLLDPDVIVLTKPFNFDGLAARVKAALAR